METGCKFEIILSKEDGNWRIVVPALGIEGIGYSDYDESISFARDLIAEYLIQLTEDEITDVTKGDQYDYGKASICVEVNYNEYRTKCLENASRIYEKEEMYSDEEEKSRGFIISPETEEVEDKINESFASTITISRGKKRIVLALAILTIIVVMGFFVGIVVKDKKDEQQIDNTINKSREYISNEKYEQGYSVLNSTRDNPKYDKHKKEIESLYYYAYLKNERGKIKPIEIGVQYKDSKLILFADNDEFYNDAESMKKEIKAEYEDEQKRIAKKEAKEKKEREEDERIASLEKEKQEAKEQKDYLEKLSTTIPFEGMEVEYIDCTACGAHDHEETPLSGQEGKYDYVYYWETEHENWFRVNIKDDEVVETEKLVMANNYWGEDGLPKVNLIKKRKDKTIDDYGSTRDSDVDSFWTGKEYADKKVNDYVEKLKKDRKYDGLSDRDIKNISWVNAYNHWLDNQNATFYDSQEYYDSVNETEN